LHKKLYTTIGHGGQFVINFPELNMIVVTTADAYVDWDTADQHERLVLDVVANYILPAIQE
ncbi:MAG: hypothetical protein KAR38_08885, partial [Calditrichia bacterium]|nr:hypothetical protein [Calditrichia bacterium]